MPVEGSFHCTYLNESNKEMSDYPTGAKNDSRAPYNAKSIEVTFCIECDSMDIDSEIGRYTCLECGHVFTDLEYEEHLLETLKSDAEDRKFEQKRDEGL